MVRLAVKLDLSKVPNTLKTMIMDQTNFAERIQQDPNQPDIVIIQGDNESEKSISDEKRKINDLLIQFKIRDYVAIMDPADSQKILTIRKEDAEGLDLFHCHHCGMEFIDEIGLGIHRDSIYPFEFPDGLPKYGPNI
jgi:hypothetical protein